MVLSLRLSKLTASSLLNRTPQVHRRVRLRSQIEAARPWE